MKRTPLTRKTPLKANKPVNPINTERRKKNHARAIINAGIKVIYCEKGEGAKGEHWNEHTKRSLQMIKEARLTVWYYGENRPFIQMGDVNYEW